VLVKFSWPKIEQSQRFCEAVTLFAVDDVRISKVLDSTHGGSLSAFKHYALVIDVTAPEHPKYHNRTSYAMIMKTDFDLFAMCLAVWPDPVWPGGPMS
jgi:hypothetical protein